MYTCPIQLSDVRYNASTQHFEASVTVHDNTILRTYACAIPAPISMPFKDAAKGLGKQAIRRHLTRGGLFSEQSGHQPQQRAGRPSVDPVQWLQKLIGMPAHHAA